MGRSVERLLAETGERLKGPRLLRYRKIMTRAITTMRMTARTTVVEMVTVAAGRWWTTDIIVL